MPQRFQYLAGLGGRIPTVSQNDHERSATTPHARHYKNEQEPFKAKGEHIKAQPVRIRRRPQLICKNFSPERPTAQHSEHEDRVVGPAALG